MELTINQIKEKQKELKKQLTKLLNDFNEETTLVVKGEINYGYTQGKNQQFITLKYSNPF